MDPTPDALRPQGTFAGLRLVDELGRGGMGTVWRARDPTGREVALKVLLRCTPQGLQRFEREGRVTARLKHPGILRVHALGEERGIPYLVYELVEGTTLERLLGRAARPELLDVLRQAAHAVGYAHKEGVVHRDLTPANVLVDGQGRARVADFGLAASLGQDRLTRTGVVLGTPHYMAPEQFSGQRDALDPATDVWALGVTLYRILTGRLPFEAASMIELGGRVLGVDPPTPRSLDPEASSALEALCLRALAKTPSQRPPDAQAFALALEAALAGEPHPLTRPLARRRRGPALALACLALAAVGGAVVGLLGHDPTPRAEVDPAPAVDTDPELTRLDALLKELPARPALIGLARLDPHRVRATPACVRALADRRRSLERALLAELRAGDPAPDDVTARLRAVGALVELAPPEAGAPASSVPLLNALLPWATGVLERQAGSPVLALEAATGLRAWITDRHASVIFTESVFKNFTAGTLSLEDLRRILVLGVQLDLCLGPQSIMQAPPEQLPRGDGPLQLYTRLRFSIGWVPDGVHQQLLALLRDPPEGLVLGPLNWAETAFAVLPALDGREREAMIRAGLSCDPRHAGLRMAWARVLQLSGDVEGGLLQAEIAVALLREQGYAHNPLGGESVWGEGLRLLTRSLAELDRRARAREVYLELLGVDHPGALQLRARFPWLDE